MRSFRSSRRRRFGGVPAPTTEVRQAAESLLRERLAGHGIKLEKLDDGPSSALGGLRAGLFAVHGPRGRPTARAVGEPPLLKMLAAAAPHRRGGRGSLGLHWMLQSDVEDYVALVDLSRESIWLMTADQFRAHAQPMPGGRFHLDWIVLRLGKGGERAAPTRVADEEAFAAFRLENALDAFLSFLTSGWPTPRADPQATAPPAQ